MKKKALWYRVFCKLSRMNLLNWMPDKLYLSIRYQQEMGKKLHWNDPQTFNEKLQYLKIYDRKPEHTRIVDKIEAKKYVADQIGQQYIIPTLGVWDDPEDIDFDALPDRFVLKCNHNSGLGMCVCTDKSKLDVEKVKAGLCRGLHEQYYYMGREWPYKNVKPRILAETFIGEVGQVPVDYKFFTFHGEIDSVMLCTGREKGYPKFFFFDTAWNRLILQREEPVAESEFCCPEDFSEMVAIVKKLAAPFIQARIDLYNVNGKIYFGEITLFNQSGFDTDITEETDIMWGKKINLP